MARVLRVGLIGDRSAEVRAHAEIPRAIALAGRAAGCTAELAWLPTASLDEGAIPRLLGYDALWCVPGSPYASMTGALQAVRFARERGCPFLGTCGGFQHALLEYARNVLGLADADHAESNPEAAVALIAPLSCSLVGATEAITLLAGSRLAAIYGSDKASERYHCNYGLDPRYRPLLEEGGLRTAGVDRDGALRAMELPDHRFFIITLFQPELSAVTGTAHPLIRAFLEAAAVAATAHDGSPPQG